MCMCMYMHLCIFTYIDRYIDTQAHSDMYVIYACTHADPDKSGSSSDTCGQYRPVLPTFSGRGTSRTSWGCLIHQVVDLKKLEY